MIKRSKIKKTLYHQGPHLFFPFMTKADKILLVCSLALALFSISFSHLIRSYGVNAIVEINGKRVAKLALYENNIITLDGSTGPVQIEVKNGKIRIASSNCPHKTCIKSGFVNKSGDTIICIPNKLVIRIIGKNNKLDITTG